MLASEETSTDLSFTVTAVSVAVAAFDVPVSAGNVFASVVVAVVVAAERP